MKRLVTISLAAVAVLYAQAALSITPAEVAKLLATDGAEDDQFGISIAVAGDTTLIGAPTDDDNGSSSGSVYVFTRDGTGNWSQQAKLTPVDAALGDHFGGSVAMEGDTAVIGTNVGAAYVFTRDGSGNWNQQAKLTDAASVVGLAVAGDTIVIGSVFESGGAAAFVFTRDGTGSWSQQAKLTATDGFGNSFGFSIDVEGNTVVIGDPGNSENGTQSGAAYVFTRDGTGNWSQQAKLTAADATKDDRFGISVARSGDTIVIGASDDDDDNNGTLQTGSAYVFTRDGTGNWSQQSKLTAPDATIFGGFGRPVAVEDDIAMIGTGGSRLQAAYVFTRDGTGNWSQQAKLTASDASQFNQFGRSIGMVGDTALIGAPNQRRAGTFSIRTGAVYVFSLGVGPIADAGSDQSVNEGVLVTLDGSASTNVTNYTWTQVAGPTVTLSSTTVANPDFNAPYVDTNTTLNFQLIVDDGQGNFSDPDTVNITVVSVNNPPVADAGDDATIKEGAIATLDGSNSFDPEGDTPIGFTWTQTTGPLVTLIPSNTVVNPSFTAPLGVGNLLTFELVVDDGKEFSTSDTVVITVVANSQPVANAGPDQTVDEGSLVNLDGTASSDPDGDTITFDWSEPVMLNNDTSPTPSFTAPVTGPGGGVLAFDLVVTDDDPINPKSSNPDQVVINVRNINDPPSCDLARAVCPSSKIKGNESCILWPPNHKLIAVNIDGVMGADAQYDDVTLQITGVTQDEPVNGGGDGDTSPDAIIQPGSPADSVLIRAERTGQENGRVYVVSFTASDGFESCTGSVSVGVPHDRKNTPVDDGQTIDSTLP